MKYLYQAFSARKSYQVKVTFDKPTKVKLMSGSSFEGYRKSRTYSYWGGHYDVSPAVFDIANDGNWVVVIEKGSHFKPIDVSGSVEIIAGNSESIAELPVEKKSKKSKKEAPQEEIEAAAGEMEHTTEETVSDDPDEPEKE